jgi:hypothetical protein
VVLRGAAGQDAIVLNGAGPEHLFIRDASGKPVFNFAGDAAIGSGVAGCWIGAHKNDGAKKPGLVVLRNKAGDDSLVLDGSTGDIVLNNADCAEDFDISDAVHVDPGTVVVIDPEGKLRPTDQRYDKRVAGVISGAGDCKPGIILDKKRSQPALVGKVYCKADASPAEIEVGDLLTTSDLPGHAMKARDPSKAFGAVIGKALSPLSTGQGLIPILIALQ